MPRGQNPNSKKALAENRAKTQFSGDRAVQAGKNSAEARAVAKPFAEYIRQQLNQEINDGKLTKEGLALTLLGQVKNGNMRAWELMLKLIGEFPDENINVNVGSIDSEQTQAMLAELRSHVKNRSNSDSN